MAEIAHLIVIPLAHGGAATMVRPFGYGEGWAADFEPIAKLIRYDFLERNIISAGKRRDGARAWLLRVVYDLLLPMLEDDQLDELSAWALRHGRYFDRGIPAGVNGFQIGLMAIFASHPKALSARDRERIGKRLWHAARHYVPLEFLTGFIKQLDSSHLEQRVANGDIEPDMDGWIVRHRFNSTSALERGLYPANINRRVLDLRGRKLGHVTGIVVDDETSDEDYFKDDD